MVVKGDLLVGKGKRRTTRLFSLSGAAAFSSWGRHVSILAFVLEGCMK